MRPAAVVPLRVPVNDITDHKQDRPKHPLEQVEGCLLPKGGGNLHLLAIGMATKLRIVGLPQNGTKPVRS